MADGVQAIVLCEGLQDWVFIRRALMALGYDWRRIRPIPFPANGRGSGEQHVREQYPREVRIHRSRATRMKTVLVVHTDADVKTTEERFESLEKALDEAAVGQRKAGERIAILIPKRSTESWIYFLDGHPVDEHTSYPKFDGRESDTWSAAESFAAQVKSNVVPTHAPPSLLQGLTETRRILAV